MKQVDELQRKKVAIVDFTLAYVNEKLVQEGNIDLQNAGFDYTLEEKIQSLRVEDSMTDTRIELEKSILKRSMLNFPSEFFTFYFLLCNCVMIISHFCILNIIPFFNFISNALFFYYPNLLHHRFVIL